MMLVLDGLTRYYGSFLALDHLSLTIHDGELHGFVGPNGAGKTTTMRILATLLKPTEGTAALDGVDVAGHPREIRRLMGYMPDFFGVYDRLKAWEYLDFYARCYGFGQKERRRMTDSLLELVNLTDKRDSYVDVLSRGMKQRLCLARALIHDPRVLLLDEPTDGLAPEERARLRSLLSETAIDRLVVLATQRPDDVEAVCARVAVLDGGKLRYLGTAREMVARAEGKVFLADLPEEALSTLRRRYRVVSVVSHGQRRVARFLDPEGAPGVGRADRPGIRDAYLLCLNGGALA